MNEIMLHKKNPDLVLVDSKMIANAPVRFLVAGIGDALSTYFEGLSNVQTQHENYVWCDKKPFVSTLSGRAVAKECFDTLMADGTRRSWHVRDISWCRRLRILLKVIFL